MKVTSILSFICCLFALSVQAQNLRTGAEQTEKLIPLLEGKRVALVGVDDLIVVDTGDALLVARRSEADKIKNIVSGLPENLV